MCRLRVAFSAMHNARRPGKWKFISAGASVAGVIWKMIRTLSSVSSCPVRVMSSVGAIRPTCPAEEPVPSPIPNVPAVPMGRLVPAWYTPRRSIAVPAYTFSDTA